MKRVVFGGAMAALVGLILGAGMKAEVVAGDLPQPELQQISFPVEDLPQDAFRPEYVITTAYAPAAAWSNDDKGQLWQSSYLTPVADTAPADSGDWTPAQDTETGEPNLNDTADAQPQPAASAEAHMPYASGMTTRSEAENNAERAAAPGPRPTSSWPNKRSNAKQQVYNGYGGFEQVAAVEAAA